MFSMNLTKIILTALIGLILEGCATSLTAPPTSFNYHFYYLDIPSHTLLGDKKADDLDLSVCAMQDAEHTCVVMLKSDFKLLYQDYLGR